MMRCSRLVQAASNRPTFLPAEHGWLLRQSGKWQVLQHVLPLQCRDEEEPQRGYSLRNRLRCKLPITEEVELVRTDMLRTKLVGSTMKVFGKMPHRKQGQYSTVIME